MPAGDRGMSDMLFCSPDGRFGAIEVKRKGNKPTPEQEEFLERVRRNGGIAVIAYSIDEVMGMI